MPIARAKEQSMAEASKINTMVSLGLADGGQDMAPTWLIHATRSVASLWPLMLAVKVAACGILMMTGGATEGGLIAGSLLWAAATLIADLLICLAPRLFSIGRRPPHEGMWSLLGLSALSAATFALWLGVAGFSQTSVLVAQAAAVVLAFAIAGNQRVIGIAFLAGSGVTTCLLFGYPHMLAALAGLTLVLALASRRQARADQHDLLKRQAAARSGKRAERLMTEYEQSGRGWFWETDRAGRLTYISAPLAKTLGTTPETLFGKPMTDLIQPHDSANDGSRTLGFHLSSRSSFNDIAVRAAVGEERWWSISGHPIVNEFGHFHGFRGSGTDLTEMRRSQAEVTRLAEYDSLTGLSNRLQMMRTLEQAITAPQGSGAGECGLLLIDLDRFKIVNDTLGHPAGDALLHQVGQRLARVIGQQGRVGRLGGDEFQVVLPGMHDRTQMAALARRVIDTLSQPYSVEGSKVVIGASIGIAVAPDDGVTTEALIRNADLALYAAKGDGRGVHRFFAQEMHADAEDRRQLEHDLRTALASDGLHLAYQPVVSATTERITGFEALLRWNHPVRGEISPALFVPIAEDAGIIAQIGEWVLRTACQQASGWPGNVRVAVNVSPIQFANPALPSIVMNALANSGLTAERLELEITESVFLNDDSDTDAMFRKLKALGVRLALDDFGTGYSSLGYLKSAPFDKIKIDQSFVRGAAIKGSRNSAIIKSIVSLAEALNMDTTAEGAETHDELDLIRSLGCSHIQGYIYGKPMLATEAIARLTDHGGDAKAEGFKASRESRKTMLRSIRIEHENHRYQARIRNISENGALIEGLWNVPEGTIFKVELTDTFIIEAEARWSRDDRMGIEFARPIDVAAFNNPPMQSGILRKAS